MIGLPFSGLDPRSPTALALPHADVRPAWRQGRPRLTGAQRASCRRRHGRRIGATCPVAIRWRTPRIDVFYKLETILTVRRDRDGVAAAYGVEHGT
jgi:hypothetical protein